MRVSTAVLSIAASAGLVPVANGFALHTQRPGTLTSNRCRRSSGPFGLATTSHHALHRLSVLRMTANDDVSVGFTVVWFVRSSAWRNFSANRFCKRVVWVDCEVSDASAVFVLAVSRPSCDCILWSGTQASSWLSSFRLGKVFFFWSWSLPVMRPMVLLLQLSLCSMVDECIVGVNECRHCAIDGLGRRIIIPSIDAGETSHNLFCGYVRTPPNIPRVSTIGYKKIRNFGKSCDRAPSLTKAPDDPFPSKFFFPHAKSAACSSGITD